MHEYRQKERHEEEDADAERVATHDGSEAGDTVLGGRPTVDRLEVVEEAGIADAVTI